MPRKAAVPSLAEENLAPGGVAAVDRALTLLTAFRSGDASLGLQDLAERTRLHKSTVLRLLASLEHAQFISRTSDGRYTLGVQIARLHPIYKAGFSLTETVMPVLRRLVGKTKESAAFHIIQGEHRVCLYRVDSPHSIRYHISEGDVLPMGRGAGGRLLTAFSGGKGDMYEHIRRDGYIVLKGDRLPELSGISAVVKDGGGQLVGAITLTMPTSRFKESFVPDVVAAATELSRQLGAS